MASKNGGDPQSMQKQFFQNSPSQLVV